MNISFGLRRVLWIIGLIILVVLFLVALRPGATATCATALDASADPIDQFAGACRLENLGFYEDARKELLTVVEANPELPVPKELQYLPGGGPVAWRELSHAFEVRKLYFAALFVGLVLIGRFALRTEQKPRLDIQGFDNGATGLELGKGLTAMVEQSLRQLDRRPRALRMALVAIPIASNELQIPEIKLVSTPLKIVSQLVDWLVPKNVYTLSGYAQKSGSRGAGLTLTLANKRGMVEENITLWQKDYDPAREESAERGAEAEADSSTDEDPTGYYLLAEPAAIWLYFQLRNRLERYRQPAVAYTINQAPRLGTEDWQSYAYFRTGVEWQLDGERDKARQMFLRALDRDPNNPAALFNLASCNVQAGDYDLALMRLQKAKDHASLTEKEDVLWYKALYQLAATYAYKGSLIAAENAAKMLVNDIDRTLKSTRTTDGMRRALVPIQPVAEILYAGIVMSRDYSPNRADAQSRLSTIVQSDRLSELSYRARYNLACYYARVGTRAKDKWNKITAYNRALNLLEYALERGGSLVQWACDDPALKGMREDRKTRVKGNETAKDAFNKVIEKYGSTKNDEVNPLGRAIERLFGGVFT